MTGPKTTRRTAVLISWVSVNHGASPLIPVLCDKRSPFRDRVERVYLLWRDAPGEDGERERRSRQQTVETLLAELGPSGPPVKCIPWRTSRPPTDHAAIREFVQPWLGRLRDDHPGAELAIHLSPGTPAMHAVWVTLVATGSVPPPVTLLQTGDQRARSVGQPVVQVVSLQFDTWLRRYWSAAPTGPVREDAAHLWDPSRALSPALRAAFAQLLEWAPMAAPVLLAGERGSGKTTLANFLRAASPFQRHGADTWPSVVCGQFRANPQLARSELFGHARGAFTGATRDHVGLLERADGDTLFLDEVSDLDSDTQRLLMAAVEGRGFHRLGDTTLRKSVFRLVSATNRPLHALREVLDADFLDRIGVFILNVPPLRACREDIPDAWRRVLAECARSNDLEASGWELYAEHSGLLGVLREHHLPGNFRDLQRAAYYLLAAHRAGRSRSETVAAAVAGLDSPAVPNGSGLARSTPAPSLPADLRKEVARFEADLVEAAMRHGGSIAKAAELLRIPRKTLEHRIRSAAARRPPGG